MKRTWKLTNRQRESIPTRYQRGESICKIAAGFGVTAGAIWEALKVRGIASRKRRLTPTQHSAALRLYRKGLSANAIARRFGFSESAILGRLRRSGQLRRDPSAAHRRYVCMHDFFTTIDTESAAYWVGFLAADGCVSIRGTTSVLILVLAHVDRAHVVRFRTALRATHPIRPALSHGHRQARIDITSRRLCDDLSAIGLIPRKTKRVRFPAIPAHLVHHFMRGYFDGDGSITPPTAPNPQVTIAGHAPFITEYQQRLATACGLGITRLARRGEMAILTYGGRNQVHMIRAFLYRDATVYLPRKKARFDGLRRSWRHSPRRIHPRIPVPASPPLSMSSDSP